MNTQFFMKGLWRRIWGLGAKAALLAVLLSAAAAQAAQPSYVKGRIIVKYKSPAGPAAAEYYLKGRKFRDSISSDSLDQLHAKHRVSKAERVFRGVDSAQVKTKFNRRSRRIAKGVKTPELSNIYRIQLDPGADERAAAEDFRRDPNVEYAELDGIATVQLTPNDPYYNSAGSWGQSYDDLYGLKKVQAGSAWDTASGQSVLVAVVDTGIDYNHPDIAANMWHNPGETPGDGIDNDKNGYVDDVYGYDFVTIGKSADSDPADGHGHGTHVAGTIAAVGNNALGVIGLAFNSKVMAVKGLSDSGSGSYSDLANALYYAANNGADVINNSWGGTVNSALIENAVNYAHSLGAVVVAAAGNSNADSQFFYPAGYANVVTVSAFDANDQKASFSNWGNKIDVAAPGVDILSLRASGTSLGPVVGSDYVRLSGTSMASPHVAGLAAVILSQHPEYTNEQVRYLLRQSADDVSTPGFDIYAGYGRINAFKAVTTPLDATPPSAVAAVNDGTGADIDQTTNDTSLSANWTASFDPESGISAYWYAIGTSSGMTNVAGWTKNGTSLAVTKTGLSLTHGSTYYFTVKAVNGIGMESAAISSNGQWVNHPPTPGNALYDPTLKAPKCGTLGSACDSGNLVNGRANIPGGAEPNQPNTINSSCADGIYGTYHVDESLDKLKLTTLDGTDFAPGKTARIEATVWVWGASADFLDLYYASDANNPAWTYLTTLTASQNGAQTLSKDYVLPNGNLQAIRGSFRYNGGSSSACTSGPYDDHDDLVFAVDSSAPPPPPDTTPPTVAIIFPAGGATVSGIVTILGTAQDDVAVSTVQVTLDGGAVKVNGLIGLANWSGSINTSLLTNGFHVIEATATDTSGNRGYHSVSVNVDNALPPPDTTPPTVAITFPANGAAVSGSIAISGTAQDDLAVSTVQVTLDGGTIKVNGLTGLANWSGSLNTNLLTNGFHVIEATATDSSGNRGFHSVTVNVDNAAPVISGVAASNITQNSADISWNTDEPSNSQVEYGLTTSYGSSTTLSSALVTVHAQSLSGLSSNTIHHYRVMSRDAQQNLAVSGDFTFVTQAPNLVLNPSFESGSGSNAFNWTEGSGHARTSDRPHSGGFSLKSTYTGNTTSSSRSDAIPVTLNTNYVVSGWIYNTSTRGQIYIDMNNITGELTLNSTLRNRWQFVAGTWNSGSRTSLVLRCATQGKPNGSVWFDDLQISPASSSGVSAAGPALLLADVSQALNAAPEGDILEDSEIQSAPLPDAAFGLREAFAYPNPASGDPTIRVSVGLADEVKFRIYDESGRKVEEAALTQAAIVNSAYVYEHRVTGLAGGVYLYAVEAAKDSQTVKTQGKFAILK